MKLDILSDQKKFPALVAMRLNQLQIDFAKKHAEILIRKKDGQNHLEAGVVLLLDYRDGAYFVRLIKRSDQVAQSGDISCPGGILDPTLDSLLSHILQGTKMIRLPDGRPVEASAQCADEPTQNLIRLFLMNALREAWEEIGLPPLQVSFLGALPTYSLTYFARTIFPVVCLINRSFAVRQNGEVDKVIDIPLHSFFDVDQYALLTVESLQGTSDPRYSVQFPCLPIPDESGQEDILWGATFHIVTNFLKICFPDTFPEIRPSRPVSKSLSAHYASGKKD